MDSHLIKDDDEAVRSALTALKNATSIPVTMYATLLPDNRACVPLPCKTSSWRQVLVWGAEWSARVVQSVFLITRAQILLATKTTA